MSFETERLLERAERCYNPTMAIIVYENEEDEDYYLESRDIDRKGNMGAGVPLSMECISEIATTYSVNHTVSPHGRIPVNLLFANTQFGNQKYIWYNPPEKRMMFFTKKLNIPDSEYHIPGLIYVATDSGLNLYAFKGYKPINKLFKAPFFNTTNGSVCLGNAKIEYPSNPTFNDIMKYWEDKFWLTEFTHLGGNTNPTRNNLVQATLKWVDKFDYNELLPMNINLKKLLP